jgi:16S rRNA (uracil1498-N3)-methyltransferase
MSAPRTLLVSAPLTDGPLVIEDDEAHHGISVLRLRMGDALRVADGAGLRGEATVTAVERRRIHLAVSGVHAPAEPRAALLTVALAAPKGDRAGDAVRALTELGVGAIWFIACERGEREPSVERMGRIAREALKQCRRSRLPALRAGVPVAELAALGPALRLMDPAGGPAEPGAPAPATVAVGPEGGFTDGERGALLAHGGVAVRLAAPILRIETAACAAAAVWAAAWDRP